jgi:hypothetical protein
MEIRQILEPQIKRTNPVGGCRDQKIALETNQTAYTLGAFYRVSDATGVLIAIAGSNPWLKFDRDISFVR